MSERVVIVVGAGGDLGRVTAEKLAAARFTVAGVGRKEAMKELPHGILLEAADRVDPAAARSVVDRIAAEESDAGRPAAPDRRQRGSGAVADPSGGPRRRFSTPPTTIPISPDQLAHTVAPEAIADTIACLVSDAAALVSGAIVPAYGA